MIIATSIKDIPVQSTSTKPTMWEYNLVAKGDYAEMEWLCEQISNLLNKEIEDELSILRK